MAFEKILIDQFIFLSKSTLVIDVRSEGEFEQGHIINAKNIPLFTNNERKLVGTTYKQVSREQAIKIGLDFFGPKMRLIVEDVEKILSNFHSNIILVYCWRGGMRSAAIAWLLDLYGFKVYTLQGGYKSYRNFMLSLFSNLYNIRIIGGNTGSGKTKVLNELKNLNEYVLDLEEIANHKGSAFGNLNNREQPKQEHFENLAAESLFQVSQSKNSILWIEDESLFLGKNHIPKNFHQQMQKAQIIFLDVAVEERLKNILLEYGQHEKEKLKEAILQIKKRLGGLETKMALEFLEQNNLESCFKILLKYYDKLYKNSLERKEDWKQKIQFIKINSSNPTETATLILKQLYYEQPESN